MSLFARVLTALLPASVLRALVATFMRLKSTSEPEDTVLDTTCGFLQSKRGVRQAMYVLPPPLPSPNVLRPLLHAY